MKKFLAVLVAVITLLSLPGCGDKSSSLNEPNQLIGTWILYNEAETTEIIFSEVQMSMSGMVKKYTVSEDGTSIIIFDNDVDKTGRSTQFMITGDVLQLEGDTLYRSGSDAEKEFLNSRDSGEPEVIPSTDSDS